MAFLCSHDPMKNENRKRQAAIALAYMEGSRAPKVVAKGRGELAQTIIEKANEAGIFVHNSPELVSMLMQVDLDQHIPAELYRAVAELLAFVYMVEKGMAMNDLERAILDALPKTKNSQEN